MVTDSHIENHPSCSICKIVKGSGNILGHGVLIDERRVITCAHNLSLNEYAPSAEGVSIKFPLLDFSTSFFIRKWSPYKENLIFGSDIALLELHNPCLKSDPIHLQSEAEINYSDVIWTKEFIGPRIDGQIRKATIFDASGHVITLSNIKDGVFAEKKMSGSGVFLEKNDSFIGIISNTIEKEKMQFSAYCIPSEAIINFIEDGNKIIKNISTSIQPKTAPPENFLSISDIESNPLFTNFKQFGYEHYSQRLIFSREIEDIQAAEMYISSTRLSERIREHYTAISLFKNRITETIKKIQGINRFRFFFRKRGTTENDLYSLVHSMMEKIDSLTDEILFLETRILKERKIINQSADFINNESNKLRVAISIIDYLTSNPKVAERENISINKIASEREFVTDFLERAEDEIFKYYFNQMEISGESLGIINRFFYSDLPNIKSKIAKAGYDKPDAFSSSPRSNNNINPESILEALRDIKERMDIDLIDLEKYI